MNPRTRKPAVRQADARSPYRRSPENDGHHAITLLDDKGRDVGRLDYQVCHECRTGYIGQIAVAGHRQRQGMGRDALHEALAHGPGYRWVTSRQSHDGRLFFTAMAEETGLTFEGDGDVCPHIAAGRPQSRKKNTG